MKRHINSADDDAAESDLLAQVPAARGVLEILYALGEYVVASEKPAGSEGCYHAQVNPVNPDGAGVVARGVVNLYFVRVFNGDNNLSFLFPLLLLSPLLLIIFPLLSPSCTLLPDERAGGGGRGRGEEGLKERSEKRGG